MVIVLDDRAPEPALLDVAAGAVGAMMASDVGDEPDLHDPADRRLAGADQEVDVAGHQAVAEQVERPSGLLIGQGGKEGIAVGVVAKDVGAVVAATDGVDDEAGLDRAQG